jgi:uncharacterized protein YjgD (DUF1641 family)
MAQPIRFNAPTAKPSDLLRARLEHAPEEHAAAVLAAYDILQQLHDRGVLDFVKSGLAASDELLDTMVGTVNTPESVRALRNLLFWRGVLGRIEPEWFQGIFQAVPDALAVVTRQRDQPVSLWKTLRRAFSRDSLRGLMAAVDLLENFGRHLNSPAAATQSGPSARHPPGPA